MAIQTTTDHGVTVHRLLLEAVFVILILIERAVCVPSTPFHFEDHLTDLRRMSESMLLRSEDRGLFSC
jgi:hypothetical protein